ncbi:MAG: DUF971 domain-containing protein [Phycisphaerae bacterium]|nr:DUF971 domain-containing protein [Phycisphaerae bacterium]
MAAHTTPTRLHLKKDERLEIDWADGLKSVYSVSLLRSLCPCAQCKLTREGQDPHQLMQAAESKPKSRLTILPGNYTGELKVESAEMVGNYAIRIDWSDQHGSGIYSFEYLRQISPACGYPKTSDAGGS